jgi:hypothetical protein
MDARRRIAIVGAGALALLAACLIARQSSVPAARKPPANQARDAYSRTSSPPANWASSRPLAPRPGADPVAQGKALHDATLKNMIQCAKVAAWQDDKLTRGALMSGLKQERARTAELVKETLAASQDAKERELLEGMLTELQ